jgi:hypothetical protein
MQCPNPTNSEFRVYVAEWQELYIVYLSVIKLTAVKLISMIY